MRYRGISRSIFVFMSVLVLSSSAEAARLSGGNARSIENRQTAQSMTPVSMSLCPSPCPGAPFDCYLAGACTAAKCDGSSYYTLAECKAANPGWNCASLGTGPIPGPGWCYNKTTLVAAPPANPCEACGGIIVNGNQCYAQFFCETSSNPFSACAIAAGFTNCWGNMSPSNPTCTNPPDPEIGAGWDQRWCQ
jgi:hypothetical protein